MSISLSLSNKSIFLTGKNTYDYRIRIKELGGKWNKTSKSWECPITNKIVILDWLESINEKKEPSTIKDDNTNSLIKELMEMVTELKGEIRELNVQVKKLKLNFESDEDSDSE